MPAYFGRTSVATGLREFAAGVAALLPFLSAGWLIYQSVDRSRDLPLQHATGRVTLDGVGVPEATVKFHLTNKAELIQPMPVATTDEHGCFTLHTPLSGQGAPVGEYRITVTAHPRVISGEDYAPGPNVLPRVYAAPHTTLLTARIEPRDNHIELALFSRHVWQDQPPHLAHGKERLP